MQLHENKRAEFKVAFRNPVKQRQHTGLYLISEDARALLQLLFLQFYYSSPYISKYANK